MDITSSLGDNKMIKNSNQVHERFHRTLKAIIREKLQEMLGVKISSLKALGPLKDLVVFDSQKAGIKNKDLQ